MVAAQVEAELDSLSGAALKQTRPVLSSSTHLTGSTSSTIIGSTLIFSTLIFDIQFLYRLYNIAR